VDQEGYIWNARWGASMLIRLSPTGQLDRTVRLPVSRPTACCFGDDDLRTLYITTARYGLSSQQLATEHSPVACFHCASMSPVCHFRFSEPYHSDSHPPRCSPLMKITAITPLICHARMRNWIFVKVETTSPAYSAGAKPHWSGTHAL